MRQMQVVAVVVKVTNGLFGKSKARLLPEDQVKTTFADVAGC